MSKDEEEIFDFEEDPVSDQDDMFTGDYIHVEDVINKVVVYRGYRVETTENGERTLVAVEVNEEKTAFYTGSKEIRKKLSQRDPSKFPFRSVLKVVSYGTFLGFKFYSPQTSVSSEDERLLSLYKKNKFKK